MYLVVAVLLIAIGGLGYLFLALPRAATPEAFQAPRTPERLARGEYLSRHVVGAATAMANATGRSIRRRRCASAKGMAAWPSNSTSGTLRAESDAGETRIVERWGSAARDDGRRLERRQAAVPADALRELLRHMSREDAEAVIAFIRTWKPAAHEVPPTQPNFPLNLIVRTIPSPAPPLPRRRRTRRIASNTASI